MPTLWVCSGASTCNGRLSPEMRLRAAGNGRVFGGRLPQQSRDDSTIGLAAFTSRAAIALLGVHQLALRTLEA
jgi:hypothetical protein